METSDSGLVVVGAGHAGSELAVAARQAGWAGRITLLGDEGHLPYHRPPLSKAWLKGAATEESLLLRLWSDGEAEVGVCAAKSRARPTSSP